MEIAQGMSKRYVITGKEEGGKTSQKYVGEFKKARRALSAELSKPPSQAPVSGDLVSDSGAPFRCNSDLRAVSPTFAL